MTRRVGARLLCCAGLAGLLAAGGCAAGPLAQGDAAFRAGDIRGAIAAWQAVPPESDAYVEAQARVRRATAYAAQIVAERLAEAEAFRSEGRLGEAIQRYREALALDPSQTEAQTRLNGLVRRLAREKAAGKGRAAARLAAGDPAGAYDELFLLKVLDPFDADLLEQLDRLEPARAAAARRHLDEARTQAARGQYGAARASATRALEFEPLAAEAERLLADIGRRERGAAVETRRTRGARAGGSPDAEAAIRRVQALQQAGRPIDALREAARAAQAHPKDGRLAAEVQALRESLAGSVDRLFVEGIRHYRAERVQLAARNWEAVLLIDPSHEKARLYLEKARRVLEKLEVIQRDEEAAQAGAVP